MSLLGDLLPWLGGLILAAVSFLLGKAFSQSEKILDQKRKAYERFLSLCPSPNEAHLESEVLSIEFQRNAGVLSIYGSPDALDFVSKYFSEFAAAQEILASVEVAGHPKYLELMTHYNRMIWAMRTDVMTWSVFAPSKENRKFRSSIMNEK